MNDDQHARDDDDNGEPGHGDSEQQHGSDSNNEVSNVSDRPGTYRVMASFKFVPLIGKPSRPAGVPLSGESPIEALELQPRTYNCLTRAGVRRVADVLPLSDEQLLAIRNFSPACLADLREQLRDFPA